MDCNDSDIVSDGHDWPASLRGLATIYRNFAELSDDPFISNELLELASVCEEVADNIEDHLTGRSPPGPLSRPS